MADTTPKPELERQIDENLKRVYQDHAAEPVPDRFMQLLAQLKEQDAKNGK